MTGKSLALILSTLISFHLFAEENCVHCPKRKVDGMPTPANIATIASVVNKAELPADFDSKVNAWCSDYKNMPPQDTLFLAKEIEASKYPFAEVIKHPNCEPSKIGGKNKITMLQLSVEQPIDRFQSLETMYKFCVKKLKNEKIFIDAVNALNTAGMTLLDYIEFVVGNGGSVLKESLDKIKNFVCAHGGVYSKYKDKKCN